MCLNKHFAMIGFHQGELERTFAFWKIYCFINQKICKEKYGILCETCAFWE